MTDIYTSINPDQAYINEWKLLKDGKMVSRFSICATPFISYKVYEPETTENKHFSTTHHEGKEYGDMNTRSVAPEILAMPAGSPERCAACDQHYNGLKAESETIIRATFPQDFAEDALRKQIAELLPYACCALTSEEFYQVLNSWDRHKEYEGTPKEAVKTLAFFLLERHSLHYTGVYATLRERLVARTDSFEFAEALATFLSELVRWTEE